MAGTVFVGSIYVHAREYRDFGFHIDFDCRVARPAPAGAQPGDQLVGLAGDPLPFRSAADAFLRVQRLQPDRTYTFVLARAGVRYELRSPVRLLRLMPRALTSAATFVAVSAMAILIARRRRRQDAGLMAVSIYLGFLITFGFSNMTVLIAHPSLFCAFIAFNSVAMPMLLHLFLRFPTPKPFLAARPRRALWIYLPKLAVSLLTALAFLLLWHDPSAVHMARTLALGHLVAGLDVVYALCGIAAMVHSFVTTGEQMRKQAQWLVYGLFVSSALGGVLFLLRSHTPFYSAVFSANDALVLCYGILACSMAFAFVEFGLLDVDRIVNRSLVYVLVSCGVAVAYLGAAGVLGVLLGRVLASDSQVVTVVATVVASALFFPLRRVVQANVDRVFFRERWRYAQTIRELAGELVTILDLDRVLKRLLDAALRDVGASHGAVVLANEAGEPELVARGGQGPVPDLRPVGPLAGTLLARIRQRAHRGLVALRVHHQGTELERVFEALGARTLVFLVAQGEPLGLLALGPKRGGLVTRDDIELFEALAPQAAIAVRNARAYRQIERLSRDLGAKHAEIMRLQARLADENLYLREALRGATGAGELVGEAPAWKAALETARRVAPTDTTVLVLGESGTGKELVARLIHDLSPRRSERPLVVVNCAAIPEALIESELLGHEKGAFTGASARRRGRFELADGGTIFLDEIGELPLAMQAKLLRVLQERELQRIGGAETIKVDVRVLAATNRDLEAAVRAGRFREDLYYRLAVVLLRLPPLRDRREDVPRLAAHFIGKFARRAGKGVVGLSEAAVARLLAYRWPGNVRELANVIERAVALAQGRVLDAEVTLGPFEPTSPTPTASASTSASTSPPALQFHEAVDEARRKIIADVLAKTGGNRAEAARILGLQRTYLYRLEKQLGLR
ncbi:MAG TPA: sigma 54-interacting transcriptional regulator [Polyangia bacterium]|nr:sigma 54-interacting transcriptional regulator [Polyangia bacterium]